MSAAAILKLEAAGFSAEQVAALAELIDAQVSTKADLEAVEHRLDLKIGGLKTEIEAVEHRLDLKISGVKSQLEGVEHRLDLKIDGVEHRLDLKISGVKTELDGVETRLELKIGDAKADIRVLKWMMGFILAFQVVIFVKLFLP